MKERVRMKDTINSKVAQEAAQASTKESRLRRKIALSAKFERDVANEGGLKYAARMDQ